MNFHCNEACILWIILRKSLFWLELADVCFDGGLFTLKCKFSQQSLSKCMTRKVNIGLHILFIKRLTSEQALEFAC